MKTNLLKLAQELEDKHNVLLKDKFYDEVMQIWNNHKAQSYIYDNYVDMNEDPFIIDLIMGQEPDQHPDNQGKLKIDREQLKQLIVSLGQTFKAKFPKAEFRVGDDPESTPENIVKVLQVLVPQSSL